MNIFPSSLSVCLSVCFSVIAFLPSLSLAFHLHPMPPSLSYSSFTRNLIQSRLSTSPLSNFARVMMSSTTASHHLHSKPKVLVPVADGSEEIETVTIVDTLVRGGADVTVASVSNSLSVVCSRGIKLTGDCYIRDCADKSWDLIVCPGGMPGAQHLSDCPILTHLLKEQLRHNRHIGAICAAPAVVLARHHLLAGKSATCYPVEKFTSKLDNFVEDKVVVDGNIITSQGPGTSLEFALSLVEILFGHEKAAALKKEMIYHD